MDGENLLALLLDWFSPWRRESGIQFGEEIMRLMKEAGFAPLEARSLPPPAYTSLVIGEKR